MKHLVRIPIRDNHGKLLPLKVYGKKLVRAMGRTNEERKVEGRGEKRKKE